MMKPFNFISRFFVRLRYPMCMPEDIGYDLGVQVSNDLPFSDLVTYLSCPNCCPTKLNKFMPRDEAESAFERAHRKEQFRDRTLISFQFHEGWMEFDLQFDAESRLRRIYLQHKHIANERGVEIKLQ